MAKQSLVEFQTKLMERLQSAEAAGDLANWLAIEAAGHKYLLPLVDAGEVVSLSSVTQIEEVAHTKPWFVGVVNLRGAPFAVVDLAGWLGLRTELPDLQLMARKNASLVAFNASLGVSCALLVDSLTGLKNDHEWSEITSAEDASGDNAGLLSDENGEVWQVMKLADLARDEYFLSIEA